MVERKWKDLQEKTDVIKTHFMRNFKILFLILLPYSETNKNGVQKEIRMNL